MRNAVWIVVGASLLGLGCGGDGSPSSGFGGGIATSGLTGVDASGEGGDATNGEAGTDAEGECNGDEDCPDGERCTPYSKICVPQGGCGEDADCELEGVSCKAGICMSGDDCGDSTFSTAQLEPNVLILLDRSGSMDGDVPGSDGTRWDVAKQVVNTTASEFDATVNFGLATFSACTAGAGCSAGQIEIPIAPGNAAAIASFLSGANADYLCDSGFPETSTGRSLDALVGNPQLQDATRENAVLVVTDGSESSECTPVDGPTAASTLFGQDIPVRVFAVGFAFSGQALDDIAMNGGTDHGYTAENQDELNTALTTILGGIVSCTFYLDEVPPDPDELYVFLDGDPAGVPLSELEGYTYDPATNSITLHGTYCDAVQSVDSAQVDVVYGCPHPPPAG